MREQTLIRQTGFLITISSETTQSFLSGMICTTMPARETEKVSSTKSTKLKRQSTTPLFCREQAATSSCGSSESSTTALSRVCSRMSTTRFLTKARPRLWVYKDWTPTTSRSARRTRTRKPTSRLHLVSRLYATQTRVSAPAATGRLQARRTCHPASAHEEDGGVDIARGSLTMMTVQI